MDRFGLCAVLLCNGINVLYSDNNVKGTWSSSCFSAVRVVACCMLVFSFLLSYGITLYAILLFIFPPANGSGNGNKPDGYNLSHIYM